MKEEFVSDQTRTFKGCHLSVIQKPLLLDCDTSKRTMLKACYENASCYFLCDDTIHHHLQKQSPENINAYNNNFKIQINNKKNKK